VPEDDPASMKQNLRASPCWQTRPGDPGSLHD